MSPFDHPSGGSASRRRSGPSVGRLLVVATLVLAATAAAVLVLASEARWLRLGVVAALWAALVAAFAAARYRRDVAGQNELAEELQRTYELELEREIAARREYELQVENSTRRMVEQEVRTEVRGELDGLRSELRGLRQNLEALLGGEVLVERVALRAESTRLRSLSDQSRAARTGERALPRGRSDTTSNNEQYNKGQSNKERPNTERASSSERTPDPGWTPEAGRAYVADTDVESTRVNRPGAVQWPAAGRGHDTSGADRTDVLPRYRAEPPRRDTPAARATPRAQPSRTGPPRAEPSRAEPVRRVASERTEARDTGEPRRAERVTPAAQLKEPARPEPQWPEPARAEPRRPESVRPEPQWPESARVEPRRPEPARVEPQWPEPARAEPRWPEPARAEPARSEPGRSEPDQPVGWPAPVRAEPGSRDMWRSDTGHLRAIDRDQPTPAGADRRRQRPAAHGQHPEYRTGQHRIPPEPPVHQDRGGQPSDPLGIDPLAIGERTHGDHGPPTVAWESFDSWVSASGSRGNSSPAPVRLDDTGSYVLPGIAGPVPADSASGPSGRRHRSDEGARSVDDLLAVYRDEPEPRHRNRHEA